MTQLSTDLRGSRVPAVWLWVSKLVEAESDAATLRALREFVRTVTANTQVNMLHSGYFGLMLSTIGVQEISHGLGYGEQKNVVPIIGQGMPMVNFYVPPLHRRVSAARVRDFFPVIGIRTPKDYFEKICECVVCKGVLSRGLNGFDEFCETQMSSVDSKRASQTPAAAKKNRYHFLLNRIKERDDIRAQSLGDVVGQLRTARDAWRQFSESRHLDAWIAALS